MTVLIRSGAFARTTETVRELVGRAPRAFAGFASDHARLYAPPEQPVGQR